MTFKVNTTWRNDNPDTIWNRLATKLGREPTHDEAGAEVMRLLGEAMVNDAEAGRLPHQRGRVR
jgi:hypothetical protein